jgi:hypothetical protein
MITCSECKYCLDDEDVKICNYFFIAFYSELVKVEHDFVFSAYPIIRVEVNEEISHECPYFSK